MSPTPSQTPQLSPSASPTRTATILPSASPSPTARPRASGPPRLHEALALPNPGAQGLALKIEGEVEAVKAEIFSAGYTKALVLDWAYANSAEGPAWISLDASGSLASLGAGVYFARVSLSSSQGRDSRLLKLVILR